MRELEHLDRATTPTAVLHTMLRVRDLERSLQFYVNTMGMTLCSRTEYPEGRFTLAFVGYGDPCLSPLIELTHNWDVDRYELGTAFGHLALRVESVAKFCKRLALVGVPITRQPGAMKYASPTECEPEIIAFVEDPDGYKIELIEGPKGMAQLGREAG